MDYSNKLKKNLTCFRAASNAKRICILTKNRRKNFTMKRCMRRMKKNQCFGKVLCYTLFLRISSSQHFFIWFFFVLIHKLPIGHDRFLEKENNKKAHITTGKSFWWRNALRLEQLFTHLAFFPISVWKASNCRIAQWLHLYRRRKNQVMQWLHVYTARPTLGVIY